MIDWSPVQSFVDGLVAERRCNGAGLAVAVEGQSAFLHFAGHARPNLAAGEDVLWPVASISKLYTGAAIMRLIEQGRLTLNLPVSQVLPEFRTKAKEEITLRHLLTHTSGLPYESPDHVARLAAQWTIDQFADEAAASDLLFPTGTQQEYSDFGYLLVGRVASRVTGTPFDELVRREVLGPAGLNATFFPTPPVEHCRVAEIEGSIGDPNTAMYNSAYGLGLAHPAFGVVATLPDLLRFALHFDRQSRLRIHSRAALDTMISDQTGTDFPAESVTMPERTIHPWGIGFMLKGRARTPELVSPESYGHGGASGCYLWIDPRYRVSVVFVSNRHYNGDPDDFLTRLDRAMNVVLAAATR
ncbi:MAG: beta-lactamase family protein [Thermomicrobiales bacterium]|nr:beta-lactamase family protein [Thermomicrobiales bacterium]